MSKDVVAFCMQINDVKKKKLKKLKQDKLKTCHPHVN